MINFVGVVLHGPGGCQYRVFEAEREKRERTVSATVTGVKTDMSTRAATVCFAPKKRGVHARLRANYHTRNSVSGGPHKKWDTRAEGDVNRPEPNKVSKRDLRLGPRRHGPSRAGEKRVPRSVQKVRLALLPGLRPSSKIKRRGTDHGGVKAGPSDGKGDRGRLTLFTRSSKGNNKLGQLSCRLVLH